ncbi:hypothetical protein IC582_030114 [Cucumis melo]
MERVCIFKCLHNHIGKRRSLLSLLHAILSVLSHNLSSSCLMVLEVETSIFSLLFTWGMTMKSLIEE